VSKHTVQLGSTILHQVAITDLVGRKAVHVSVPVCAREQRDTPGRHKPFKNITELKQTTERRIL
jgi:hypothetical protein